MYAPTRALCSEGGLIFLDLSSVIGTPFLVDIWNEEIEELNFFENNVILYFQKIKGMISSPKTPADMLSDSLAH